MLKDNAKIVFNYVKEHDGENITAATIADKTGLPKKSVDGIITAAFCGHKDADKNKVPLMERVPAEVELSDGTHKPVKLIRMTDAGRAFDPDAE